MNKEYRLKISALADAEPTVIWSSVALGCLSRSAEAEGTPFSKIIIIALAQLVQTGGFQIREKHFLTL